jgi:hypothetical protein
MMSGKHRDRNEPFPPIVGELEELREWFEPVVPADKNTEDR